MEPCDLADGVRRAQRLLGALDGEKKNDALRAIGRALDSNREKIIEANCCDLDAAKGDGLSAPLSKRLRYGEEKIGESLSGLVSLATLPDPVGKTLSARRLDTGLDLFQVTCPIGVVGMIFESRPDALVQIAALCLKSGNGVILKGGREAQCTNRTLAEIIRNACVGVGLPEGWIALVETREEVSSLLKLDDRIDLLIPRGSNEFVRYIMENSLIPVMGHADGVCHLYIDQDADLDMAVQVAVDSKTQYVAVCNALETLLVDRQVSRDFLPKLAEAMGQKQVELRGCIETCSIIDATAATEEDWRTEYLDYILSIKVVDGIEDAVEHINRYGSRHTDGIVTGSAQRAEYFMNHVDSADLFWNCSTRFSDGFRYGLGAEVGVSTGKLHARGPVGLEGLVTYSWRLYGSGQVVADYSGEGAKKFLHQPILGEK